MLSLQLPVGRSAAARAHLLAGLSACAGPPLQPVAPPPPPDGVTPCRPRSPAARPAEGQQLQFANTYHLLLHPGADVVAAAGGLHAFMNRQRPMITDSGGFQVGPPAAPPGMLAPCPACWAARQAAASRCACLLHHRASPRSSSQFSLGALCCTSHALFSRRNSTKGPLPNWHIFVEVSLA